MGFWRTAHWFTTSKCNQNCVYCFKPNFNYEDSKEVVQELAEQLIENKFERVVFTGGEPLLLKNLETALKVLKNGGIDTSIHTNATLLTPRKTRDLAGLVDEIAIPIDSLDRQTQEYLRQEDCLPKVKQVLRQLQNLDVRIGIHTVATSLNIKEIPKIYKFLSKKRFDYWKVYEINADLVSDRFEDVERFREIEKLRGEMPTEEDGGINCLFANFLLTEEKITKNGDEGVKFVGVTDYDREPYFFLDTGGNVYFCNWFLQGQRKYMGNVLKEGFRQVKLKAIRADREGPLLSEEAFIEAKNSLPLWARAAWEGNYFWEEIEAVLPGNWGKFCHLSELYLERLKKQEGAPEDAVLTMTLS